MLRVIRIFVSMDNGEIIIYRTADGETRLEVRMESDSVWLTPGADGGVVSDDPAEYYNAHEPRISRGRIGKGGNL